MQFFTTPKISEIIYKWNLSVTEQDKVLKELLPVDYNNRINRFADLLGQSASFYRVDVTHGLTVLGNILARITVNIMSADEERGRNPAQMNRNRDIPAYGIIEYNRDIAGWGAYNFLQFPQASLLQQAVRFSAPASIVGRLLDKGASPQYQDGNQDTVLHIAAFDCLGSVSESNYRLDLIRQIINHYQEQCALQDPDGEAVSNLLNLQNSDSHTALQRALQLGDLSYARLLYTYGASMNIPGGAYNDKTPLGEISDLVRDITDNHDRRANLMGNILKDDDLELELLNPFDQRGWQQRLEGLFPTRVERFVEQEPVYNNYPDFNYHGFGR